MTVRNGVRRCLLLAPIGLAALILAVAAGPSSAHSTSSSATKVTALTVSPHALSHSGGTVQLHATVKHASKCTVSSSPHLAGLPKTRSCSSGHLTLSLHVGADSSSSPLHIALTVKAVKHSHHASRSVSLTQAGSSTPATPTNTTPTSTTPTSTTPTSATPTSTTPTSTTPTSTTPTSTTPAPTPITSTASADAPLPSNASLASNENAALVSVSCPAAADCVAVGTYFGTQGSDSSAEESVIETFNGSTWTPQQAPMPSDVYASEPDVVLDSVSCSSASACVAVGEYIGSNAGLDPYVAVLSGGSWTWEPASTPTESSNSMLRLGGNLVEVSCASDGICVAAGTYHPTSQSQPLLEVPTVGGDWDGMAGPLPENADTGTGPLTNYLNSVSCASATDCAAVGGYESGGNEYGLGETWTGTDWVAGQLPPTADSGDDYSVSCAGSACAATGDYNTNHSVIQAASGGAWTGEVATTLPTTNTGSAKLNAITCATSSSCLGVGGYYTTGSDYFGLIDSGAGSSWTATQAPLPSNADSTNPDVNLTAASCTVSGSCVAVGAYFDQSSGYDSLLDTGSESAGGWTAQAPPAPASGTNSVLNAVSCVASYGCVAVGTYTTADSGSAGEFAVTPL